ncbi:MAG: hypothetical protein PHW76_08225, partial [Alphaproteobacteria bacterium]|nr:hypothetical protein [Alphaproteobacteria bacterium]
STDRKKRSVCRAYKQYSSGRQTLANLSERYRKSVRTLRRNFDRLEFSSLKQTISSAPVALTFDATFFGRGYGLLVYRAEGKNIYWQEIVSERISDMENGLSHLISLGWKFSSITIDGRKGTILLIKRLFPEMPIQLCLFHQKAIVRRYLTGHPKTPCGCAIKNLAAEILSLSETDFLARLQNIYDTYAGFLKERNDLGQFKHRRLRSALRSLRSNAPFLFTYKRHPDIFIPHTTNSCDGSFAHWKNKVRIHRGLSKERRAKMIGFLLSNP